MAKFAKGKYAMGICARSGRKMPLKDMVPDGYKPGLMVDPAWRDTKHPAEKPQHLIDGVALKRPAPDVDDADLAPGSDDLVTALGFTSYFGGGT